MGTRGAVGFVRNGVVKAAYNHWDSYPDCLGRKVAMYVSSRSPEQLNVDFDKIEVIDTKTPPTDEDIARWSEYTDVGVSAGSTSDWYCLMRRAQGSLEAYAAVGQMPDNAKFMRDSLFCEYAYLVNLDTNTLDFYVGFQKRPPLAGIFSGDDGHDGDYYACDLVESIPFKDALSAIDRIVSSEDDED